MTTSTTPVRVFSYLGYTVTATGRVARTSGNPNAKPHSWDVSIMRPHADGGEVRAMGGSNVLRTLKEVREWARPTIRRSVYNVALYDGGCYVSGGRWYRDTGTKSADGRRRVGYPLLRSEARKIIEELAPDYYRKELKLVAVKGR